MLFFDALAGYFAARFIAGKTMGQKGRIKSLRVHVKRDWVVHFHHWFFSILIIGAFLWADVQSTLAYAFFTGSAIHGLTYPDFYKLVYKHSQSSSFSSSKR